MLSSNILDCLDRLNYDSHPKCFKSLAFDVNDFPVFQYFNEHLYIST